MKLEWNKQLYRDRHYLVEIDPTKTNHPALLPKLAIITHEPETEDEEGSWRIDQPKAGPPRRYMNNERGLELAKAFCECHVNGWDE